MGLLEVKWVC